MQLLKPELISEMALLIITKFFTFRQIDLQAWEEDEDEWEIREEGGGDTWEFEIRPCAERLFMDLVINFQSLLIDPLVSFISLLPERHSNAALSNSKLAHRSSYSSHLPVTHTRTLLEKMPYTPLWAYHRM